MSTPTEAQCRELNRFASIDDKTPSKVLHREEAQRDATPRSQSPKPSLIQPPPPKLTGIGILRWWLPELFASLLSIASFIAIVVVLHIYNGRALDDVSLPYGLTLNGILAILSTIARVSLMMPVGTALSQEAWLWLSKNSRRNQPDSCLGDLDVSDAASRGPLGSIVFLWSSRGHRILGSLGAIITFLSLAFGTFTQQLLAIESLAVTDPNEFALGNIPRSEELSSYSGSYAWGLKPTLRMKAAIFNGIFTDNIASIAPHCPTGNCSWPPTSSLAVCGGCVESRYTTECLALSAGNKAIGSSCNYTMPSGSITTVRHRDTDNAGALWLTGFQMTSGTEGSYFKRGSEKRLYLANFDLFGAPAGVERAVYWPEEPWPNASTVASECALWMCVNTYETIVESGQQVQNIISSLDVNVSNDEFNGGNFTANSSTEDARVVDAMGFRINYYAWLALSGHLLKLLNGTVNLGAHTSYPSSDAVEAFRNHTADLDRWIQNLAVSMTNVIRTDVHSSRDEFEGTAYQLAYVVRWGWLALPAAMVLFSVVFWLAIMVQTAKSPVESWKGSPLTILLFDVDEETKQKAQGQTNQFGGIERAIAKRKSVLVGEPGGLWKFQAR